jgi:hypothetical protein
MEVGMSASPERRLFQAYWDDGTLDLVVGAAVALIGVGYVVEQLLAEIVVVPLGIVAWMVLRARVVEPRAGYVKLSRSRRERSTRELAATVGVGIGMMVFCAALALKLRTGDADLARWVGGLPALLVALPVLIAGALIRAPRFSAYAAAFVLGAVACVPTGFGPGVPLMVGGAVMGAVGATLLARFLAGARAFREAE